MNSAVSGTRDLAAAEQAVRGALSEIEDALTPAKPRSTSGACPGRRTGPLGRSEGLIWQQPAATNPRSNAFYRVRRTWNWKYGYVRVGR